MGRCREAYGTMARVADWRGVGHARQSQYSAAVKSGVNSQKSLLNSVQVPIPISKVRYHKDASGGVTMESNRPSMKARRGYYESGKGYRKIEIGLCEVFLRSKSGCGPRPIWLWSKAGREVVVNESGCGVRTGRLDEPVSSGEMVESGQR